MYMCIYIVYYWLNKNEYAIYIIAVIYILYFIYCIYVFYGKIFPFLLKYICNVLGFIRNYIIFNVDKHY